jgi:hypothetical protein
VDVVQEYHDPLDLDLFHAGIIQVGWSQGKIDWPLSQRRYCQAVFSCPFGQTLSQYLRGNTPNEVTTNWLEPDVARTT